MRFEEFQRVVEQALDRILTGDMPFAVFIHGHGNGYLKNWLRNYLKKHPEFRWEIPEQSGDESTKVFL